jgi:hypothetical protein
MEFIGPFKDNNSNYTSKIKDSKYLQGNCNIVKEIGCSDISEIIIGKYDIEYMALTKEHKDKFITEKKMNISQEFDKYKDKYNKKFNYNLIQTSFQGKNYLSTILFLNDFYKVNTIIYNTNTNKYYKTSLKDYSTLICIYKDNSWFHSEEEHNIPEEFNDINDLSNILTIDTSISIFKPYLKGISGYKLSELHIIAGEMDVSIVCPTTKKNKLKKQLYDDINLKHYKNNI